MGGRFKDDDSTDQEPEDTGTVPPDARVPRRTVLRLGTVAAAGAGAAALIPATTADRADAAAIDSIAAVTLATKTMNEAFGGVFVRPRALERWMCSTKPVRHIVCVGDSITSGKVGGFNYAAGGRGSWTERLATAAGNAIGPNLGYGFRGLWLRNGYQPEWQGAGTWTRTSPSDVFDVCPFANGLRSSDGPSATLTWTRPTSVTVAGFDLYWFNMEGAGNWQYRVDNGPWVNMGQALTPTDNKLHKFYVGQPVQTRVQIRAYNGSTPCLAPIGGISVYASDPNTTRGLVIHNLGAGAEFLSDFVRASAGDPLAWFDGVVSNPTSLGFRPDLVTVMFSNDVVFNNTTQWTNNLLKLVNRVHPHADVLLMNPYEQAGISTTAQAAYRAATTSVATTHRCAVLDLYIAYSTAGATGWSAANTAGLMLDNLHPSQLGHSDIAARVWRLLRNFS